MTMNGPFPYGPYRPPPGILQSNVWVPEYIQRVAPLPRPVRVGGGIRRLRMGGGIRRTVSPYFGRPPRRMRRRRVY